MFTIDATDPTPIYAQLERGIRVAIATGQMRPGDQLPTVRQLAVDLRVAGLADRLGLLDVLGLGQALVAAAPARGQDVR